MVLLYHFRGERVLLVIVSRLHSRGYYELHVVQLLGRPFPMTMADLWLGDLYLSMRMMSSIAWRYSDELSFGERVPSLDGI